MADTTYLTDATNSIYKPSVFDYITFTTILS